MITNEFLYHFINFIKLFKIFLVVSPPPSPDPVPLDYGVILFRWSSKNESIMVRKLSKRISRGKYIYIKIQFKK